MKKTILFIIIFTVFASLVNAEQLTYDIGMHEIYGSSDYQLIAIQNGENWETNGAINEPVGRKEYIIPSDKAIKNVEIINSLNPINLNANLPEIYYINEQVGFKERSCFLNERSEYVDYSESYDIESELIVEYHPLAIKDCKKGEWALYEKLEIEVEYHEENKFKTITHTPFNGGKVATINLELENLGF